MMMYEERYAGRNPHYAPFRALRLPDKSREEFLASTDVWFRPVAFANGPEGALYIADLYREIIDFSDGVPESVKRIKDLNRGNDRGRIYRVVPEEFQQPSPPRLGSHSTGELVATLAHPNAWHRESASRLLYERQDKSAIPALVELFEGSESSLGRLHALYSLDGLGALAENYVVRALEDPDPGVREHAVRLTEKIVDVHGLSERLWQSLKDRLHDPAPRVRYQLAFTLGEIRHPERVEVLVELLKRDMGEPWLQASALTSLAEGPGEVFSRLTVDAGLVESASGRAFLRDLARLIGSRNRGRELLAFLHFLDARKQDLETAFPLLAAFADGLQQADVPLELFQTKLQPILDRAVVAVRDSRSPEPARVQAIEVLGLAATGPETLPTLLSLIEPDQPRAVQAAAVSALARLQAAALAPELLRRWNRFTPALRQEVLPLLLARPERALAFIYSETETSVTLRQPFGSENTLLRSNISRIQSLEQSIMPEGLEEGLSVQDMADLLEFVVNAEEEDWGP